MYLCLVDQCVGWGAPKRSCFSGLEDHSVLGGVLEFFHSINGVCYICTAL